MPNFPTSLQNLVAMADKARAAQASETQARRTVEPINKQGAFQVLALKMKNIYSNAGVYRAFATSGYALVMSRTDTAANAVLEVKIGGNVVRMVPGSRIDGYFTDFELRVPDDGPIGYAAVGPSWSDKVTLIVETNPDAHWSEYPHAQTLPAVPTWFTDQTSNYLGAADPTVDLEVISATWNKLSLLGGLLPRGCDSVWGYLSAAAGATVTAGNVALFSFDPYLNLWFPIGKLPLMVGDRVAAFGPFELKGQHVSIAALPEYLTTSDAGQFELLLTGGKL